MLAAFFPVEQASMEPTARFDGASLPTLLLTRGSNSLSHAKLQAAQRTFPPSGASMPKFPAGFKPPPGLPHPLANSNEEEHQTMSKTMSDKSTTVSPDSPTTLSEGTDQLDEEGYIPGRALRCAIAGPPDAPPSQVLNLSSTITDQPKACGCPSVGSIHHHLGLCVPCDFINRNDACRMGAACKFCHLCGPEANKQKKKHRARALKLARKWQEAVVEHTYTV